jgi:hypothetical protein
MKSALLDITPNGSTAKPTAKPKDRDTPVILAPMKVEVMRIHLVGDSPLVCHAWAEKATQMMLDKQMKKSKQAKEAKDPHQCFMDSLYHMPGEKYGFPTLAFKSAAVDACSHIEGITKVQARGAFHIPGDITEIVGTPTMRRDMVRIGMGTADIRFRGEFINWSTTLIVRFNSSVLSPEQIVHLFNTAGFAIGVGEHRPEKNGSWGMFHVGQLK